MRHLTEAAKAAIDAGEFVVGHFIALHYSTPIYLTTHHRNVSYGNLVYQAAHGHINIPKLSSSSEDRKGTIKISLPNTDGVFDQIIQSHGFSDIWLNIGIVYLNKKDEALDVLELFGGKTTSGSTTTNAVQFSAASYHSIFEKVIGIRTTEVSHQRAISAAEREDDYTMWWAGNVTQFKVKL